MANPTPPTFSLFTYFPAFLGNALTRDGLDYWSYATAPRQPFRMMDNEYDNTVDDDDEHLMWEGYILHRSNTFAYNVDVITDKTSVNVYVNGTKILDLDYLDTQNGTVDITALSLTAGIMYTVTVTANRSGTVSTQQLNAEIYYLGETYTGTYTALTAFTVAQVPTAAQLDAIATQMSQLATLADFPLHLRPEVKTTSSWSVGNEYNVARYCIFKLGNYLAYDFTHETVSAGSPRTKISINGTDVVTQSGGTGASGVYDFSALALTIGQACIARIYHDVTGTVSGTNLITTVKNIQTYSTATPPATVPSFTANTDCISHTKLNWFGAMVEDIHPESGTAVIPLVYLYPAHRTQDTSSTVRMLHRKRYLHYWYDGAGTVNMNWGNGLSQDLPAAAGQNIVDLESINQFSKGQVYSVDEISAAYEDNNN